MRGGMLRAAPRTFFRRATTTGMTAIRTMTMIQRAASAISATCLTDDERGLGGNARERRVDGVQRAVDVRYELRERAQVLGLDRRQHAAEIAEAVGDDVQ